MLVQYVQHLSQTDEALDLKLKECKREQRQCDCDTYMYIVKGHDLLQYNNIMYTVYMYRVQYSIICIQYMYRVYV